jgi:hypothetical protein
MRPILLVPLLAAALQPAQPAPSTRVAQLLAMSTSGGLCQVRAASPAARRLGIARVVSFSASGGRQRISVQLDSAGRVRHVGTATEPRPSGAAERLAAVVDMGGDVTSGALFWTPAAARPGEPAPEQSRALQAAEAAGTLRLARDVRTRCGA